MSEESDRLELPRNEEIAFEIIYDESTDGLALSNGESRYSFDQSGSTVALTDANGGVTDRVEYSPFGTITYRTGTTDTPYLYAGQFGIQQEGNGLLCMRARYYSPELQRFINADPIGFAGGLNWYQYAAGNPIMYGDPSGNSPALLLIPLIWWGTTQTANAPGPGDRTTNDTPFVAPASMALGVGPTVAASRTIVRSSMTAGRGFMNTLTGPATSSAVRNAGTMSFEAGNAGLSLMTQAGTQAATNALRQFASQALSYGGVYTAGTFVGGGITGLLTPTDASSLFPSGNPLMAPFEAGNLAGSFVGNTYNAVSEFFAQPVSTNFK